MVVRNGDAHILPRETGEGDRAEHGGGGSRDFNVDRLAPIFSQSLKGRSDGCPLHHPSDGPPPPFHGGGWAHHSRRLAICFIALATPALAGEIEVTSPWLRATPKGASIAAGYATIINKGSAPDRLLGASIPMAPKGEIHSMTMDQGVMHMRRLDEGLAVAPGATVKLTPGGYHFMFLQPKAVLKEGEKVGGTLTFEKAGKVAVTFPVAGFGAKDAPK